MTWTDERRKKMSDALRKRWGDETWASQQRSRIARGFKNSPGHKPKQRCGVFALTTYVDQEVREALVHYAKTHDLSLTDSIERAVIQFLQNEDYDV